MMVVSIEQYIPDIRLVQNNQYPAYSVVLDWQLLGNGSLDDTYALATAVAVALGTNALAGVDDLLPDPDSTDRQGWWGDMDADTIWNGWPIGSKLWLLRRSSILPSESKYGATQTWVNNYIRNAVQPFVDQKICSSFEIISVRVDKQRIDALVRLYRGPKTAIDLQYQILWQGIQS
ncbi:MAG TPA: phage GP46 family protein [Ktedonobacteraceae bacterium]|jgi:phage gp46-like protein|nr:phage GP46 family protein [Ktedonobacteraceae bacterium]